MNARMYISVERFFETALLGLLSTGYAALLATGRLPLDLAAPAGIAILLRCAVVTGWLRLPKGNWAYFIPALVCLGWPAAMILLHPERMDYALSLSFYLFCAVSVVFASSRSESIFLALIALLELAGAAVLSSGSLFFLFLVLFVGFSLAALMSAEMLSSTARSSVQVAKARHILPWRLAGLSAMASIGILLFAAVFFLIVPRTARGARAMFPKFRTIPGFAAWVDLGRFGEIGNNNRPVLHVLPYGKAPLENLRWRGRTQIEFDGKRWSSPRGAWRNFQPSQGTVNLATPLQRSRRDGPRIIYRVDMQDSRPFDLFIAGIPEFINMDADNLRMNDYGDVLANRDTSKPFRYEVSAQLANPVEPAPKNKRPYLQLPRHLDSRIREQAIAWAGEGTALQRAHSIESHLRNDFQYELRLPKRPAPDPLADFLFVRKKGHCEYFASALAVMLRTQGIPSRLVTGFAGGYFNTVSGLFVVRSKDAHAWVEAYFEDQGWVTLDGTPYSREEDNRPTWLRNAEMYFDFLDNGWREWVTGYDLGRQVTLAAKAETTISAWKRTWDAWKATPEAIWVQVKKWSLWTLGWITLFTAGFYFVPKLRTRLFTWLRRRALVRFGKSPRSYRDASLLYARMLELLARRGFEKPAWFTASEFARHVKSEEAPLVREFTAIYERSRFGQDEAAIAELARLLTALETISATPAPGR